MKFNQNNEVHLWLIPNAKAIKDNQLHILSVKERDRLQRFRFHSDQLLFYSAHLAMRYIFADYFSMQPEQIEYTYLEKGKPMLTNSPIQFNLSHSEKLSLLSITQNDMIGVDVEYNKPKVEFERLAERFFSSDESDKLKSLDEKADSFYRCWTRKEAFIKAIGEGLSYPLSDFEVSFLEDEEPKFISIKDGDEEINHWRLLNIDDLPPNYYGAISVRKKHVNLSQYEFDWSKI